MKLNQWLVMAGVAAVMSLGANQVVAQPSNGGGGGFGGGGRPGRGNFDPAQFQQRMMERYKEMLEVTDDSEWKAMEPLVQKVMDLRRESFSGMGRGMFGRGPPGRRQRAAERPGPATARRVLRRAQPGSRSVAEGD